MPHRSDSGTSGDLQTPVEGLGEEGALSIGASGVLYLGTLYEHAKGDPAGLSVRRDSLPHGKQLSARVADLVSVIPAAAEGLYAWGTYQGGFWKYIYTGQSKTSTHAGLRRRLCDELSEWRPIYWRPYAAYDEIKANFFRLYPNPSYRGKDDRRFNTNMRKIETSHVLWVAVEGLTPSDTSEVTSIEAELISLIRRLGPLANAQHPRVAGLHAAFAALLAQRLSQLAGGFRGPRNTFPALGGRTLDERLV